MSSNFHLPPLPNTSEVTIGRWLKQPGDQVIASENLVEVYSEQYDWDIPSPRAGTLQEIRVPAGGCARPGDVIAVLDGSASEPEVAAPRANQRVSPLAARMAAAHGIDTVSIKGTGVGERVTKNDLLAFIQAHTPPPVPPPAVSADVLVALTPAHAAMADLLARSKESMPHVSSFVEVDMGRILAQRDARQAAWRNREGFELTTTPYLILAAVAALRAVPVVNGMFSPAGAVLKKSINIGVTIAADGGSVTPMLQNAETYNLVGIARRVRRFEERAASGQGAPDDLAGGTFTIEHREQGGSLLSTALVQPLQAATLTIGTIHPRAVAIADALDIRPVLMASLNYDHRLIDGIVAGQFLSEFKRWLETEREY